MGTGATIKTGGNNKSSYYRSSATANSYYSRDSNPYMFGKVITVNTGASGEVSIIYTPLVDRITSSGNEKQGIAYPLYINQTKIPEVGSIVPLLRAPSRVNQTDVSNVVNQYSKSTYYLDPVDIQGTVNNNTVGDSSSSNNNLTPNSTSNTNIGAVTPTKGSENVEKNKLFTKNFLKSKGLTKEQAAGIMGNAYAECGFKVEMPPNQDTKGFSFGLIQWNSNSYPDAYQLLMPNTNDPRPAIEKQCEALFNGYTHGLEKYLKFTANNVIPDEPVKVYGLSNNILDADIAAFIFARTVERCSYCITTKSTYDNGGPIQYRGKTINVHPSKRSQFALGFMQKFNDPNDPLYWG